MYNVLATAQLLIGHAPESALPYAVAAESLLDNIKPSYMTVKRVNAPQEYREVFLCLALPRQSSHQC